MVRIGTIEESVVFNACTSWQDPYISKIASDRSMIGLLFRKLIDALEIVLYADILILALLVTRAIRLFDRFTGPETSTSKARSNDVITLLCRKICCSWGICERNRDGICSKLLLLISRISNFCKQDGFNARNSESRRARRLNEALRICRWRNKIVRQSSSTTYL